MKFWYNQVKVIGIALQMLQLLHVYFVYLYCLDVWMVCYAMGFEKQEGCIWHERIFVYFFHKCLDYLYVNSEDMI